MSDELFDQDLERLARRARGAAGGMASLLRRLWWRWRPAWLGCCVCGAPATRRDRAGWTCDRHSDPVRFGV